MTGTEKITKGSDANAGRQGLDTRLVVERGAFRLDVTLAAEPGDVVALLGPNGAGKTTAMRALAGLLPLSDGHLSLDGSELHCIVCRQGSGRSGLSSRTTCSFLTSPHWTMSPLDSAAEA